MSEEVKTAADRLRIGQILLVIVLLSALLIVGLKMFPNKGDKSVTRVPREMQINYMPADFTFDVDEEYALAVLTNPKRYRREFNQLVYDLNMAILTHVANRMGLRSEDKRRLPAEYDKQHAYLRNLYYEDFLLLQDSTSRIYQTWYDNQFKSATNVLFEVASKYTCFLVNSIIGPMVPMKDGAIFGKGKGVETPCGIAMNEALAPYLKKLEDRAAIEDFGRANGLLQEKVEKVIGELATLEVRDKKGLSKQLKTKVFGFNVSSTDIQISAISIAKIGFQIDQYFKINLNPNSKVVTVTLPQPVILSHEVYPKLDKLDIGWLREVSDADFNRAFNILREEFRRDIYQSDAFDKSKAQAKEILNTMLGPVITSFNPRFQLRVEFQEAPTPAEFRTKDEFSDLNQNSSR